MPDPLPALSLAAVPGRRRATLVPSSVNGGQFQAFDGFFGIWR